MKTRMNRYGGTIKTMVPRKIRGPNIFFIESSLNNLPQKSVKKLGENYLSK